MKLHHQISLNKLLILHELGFSPLSLREANRPSTSSQEAPAYCN